MDQNSERYTVQILPPTSDSQAQFSFPEQFLVVLLQISHAYTRKYVFFLLYKNVSILWTLSWFLLFFHLKIYWYLGGLSISIPKQFPHWSGLLKSRCQDGIRPVRHLLEEMPVRKRTGGGGGRGGELKELSDREANLPLWRREGRKEGWVGSDSDCNRVRRKCQTGLCLGSP